MSNNNIFTLGSGIIRTLNSTHKPLVVPVRHHVKMWPIRKIRTARESQLDNTKVPYTEGHNINEFSTKKKKKPWQLVIPKNKDARFNSYNWNPLYTSDPKEAFEHSKNQLDSLEKSLLSRGPCRDTKPYDPPKNVDETVIDLLRKCLDHEEMKLSSPINPDELPSINLNDHLGLKFKLLSACIEKFNHDVPSGFLNEIERVSDVVDYFSKPVRGINSYSAMTRSQEKSLPRNLHLIPEAVRFDRETDTKFNSYNALPGIVSRVQGLRGGKKYPTLNQDEFQWPDI